MIKYWNDKSGKIQRAVLQLFRKQNSSSNSNYGNLQEENCIKSCRDFFAFPNAGCNLFLYIYSAHA